MEFKVRDRLDVRGDAARAFDVLMAGGVVLVPGDMGYGFVTASPEALQRIFASKQRAAHKRNGMLGSWELHREVHVVGERAAAMIDTIVLDYDLPLGVVAPYRPEHPVIRAIPEDTLRASTVNGTINLVLNAGRVHEELMKLARQATMPLLGSSANLSGTGIKYRVSEIEPEIIDIADLVLDYGLRRYHHYGRASTLINFSSFEVVRAGCCYDLIADILNRHFDWELPADPGDALAPGGHLPAGR